MLARIKVGMCASTLAGNRFCPHCDALIMKVALSASAPAGNDNPLRDFSWWKRVKLPVLNGGTKSKGATEVLQAPLLAPLRFLPQMKNLCF